MGEALLCLDIHEEMVVAVAIERRAGLAQVLGCVKVDTAQQSFAAAIDQVKLQLGNMQGKCAITLGAELFSFRNLSLPFTDKKKIDQVLSMELAEQTLVDIDTLVLDYMVTKTGSQGAEIFAAMLGRAGLAERLAVLRAAGLEPDYIGVSGMGLAENLFDQEAENYILLDIDCLWATLFLVRKGKVAAIRSLNRGAGAGGQGGVDAELDLFIKQTLLGCGLAELRQPGCVLYYNGVLPPLPILDDFVVKKCTADRHTLLPGNHAARLECRPESLARAVAGCLLPDNKSGFNFCKEEFRKGKTFGDYRRRVLLFGGPVLLFLILAGIYYRQDYLALAREQEALKQQIAEVFTSAVPTATRIVHPVQQLQVAINEIKATFRPGGISTDRLSVIDLLAEISARIPVASKVKVVRLVADAEALQVKALTGDFNTVDAVQKELEKSPIFKEVLISSANQSPQGDAVSFELKLVLAGK